MRSKKAFVKGIFGLGFILLCTIDLKSEEFSLWLDTGGELRFMSPQEVKEDWEEGFAKDELELKRHGKIWDYMDGEEGFSEWEKGYWIAYYGRTKNIRERLMSWRSGRDKIMYQVYYLQRIILNTRGGNQFFLHDILQELKNIVGNFEEVRSIRKTRIKSGQEYLRKKLGFIFEELGKEEQNLLGEYQVQRSDENKEKLLNYYKDRKSDYEWKKKNLNRLLEEKKGVLEGGRKILREGGEDIKSLEKILEGNKKKQQEKIREKEKKLNFFLIVLKEIDWSVF